MRSDDADWGIIYDALIHAIKTNSGIGFHNRDQGHPAYVIGASDGTRDRDTWGDSPDRNSLYKMLLDLSETYGKSHGIQITNWRSFCLLAYESYQKAKLTPGATGGLSSSSGL
jgi:hypothetical protein